MEKLEAPASKDNPRTLRKKGSDTPVTVTDAGEYLSMTSGLGYLDITDGDPEAKGSKSRSSSAGTQSAAKSSGASGGTEGSA